MMFFCPWHLTDVVPPVTAILLSNFANSPSVPRLDSGAYCSFVSSMLVSPLKNETSDKLSFNSLNHLFEDCSVQSFLSRRITTTLLLLCFQLRNFRLEKVQDSVPVPLHFIPSVVDSQQIHEWKNQIIAKPLVYLHTAEKPGISNVRIYGEYETIIAVFIDHRIEELNDGIIVFLELSGYLCYTPEFVRTEAFESFTIEPIRFQPQLEVPIQV